MATARRHVRWAFTGSAGYVVQYARGSVHASRTHAASCPCVRRVRANSRRTHQAIHISRSFTMHARRIRIASPSFVQQTTNRALPPHMTGTAAELEREFDESDRDDEKKCTKGAEH